MRSLSRRHRQFIAAGLGLTLSSLFLGAANTHAQNIPGTLIAAPDTPQETPVIAVHFESFESRVKAIRKKEIKTSLLTQHARSCSAILNEFANPNAPTVQTHLIISKEQEKDGIYNLSNTDIQSLYDHANFINISQGFLPDEARNGKGLLKTKEDIEKSINHHKTNTTTRTSSSGNWANDENYKKYESIRLDRSLPYHTTLSDCDFFVGEARRFFKGPVVLDDHSSGRGPLLITETGWWPMPYIHTEKSLRTHLNEVAKTGNLPPPSEKYINKILEKTHDCRKERCIAADNIMRDGKGTSWCSPKVAGILARIKSTFPVLTDYDLTMATILASNPVQLTYKIDKNDIKRPELISYEPNGAGLWFNSYNAGYGLLDEQDLWTIAAYIHTIGELSPAMQTQRIWLESGTITFNDNEQSYRIPIDQSALVMRTNLILQFKDNKTPPLIELISPSGGAVTLAPSDPGKDGVYSITGQHGHAFADSKGHWDILVPDGYALETAALHIPAVAYGGALDLVRQAIIPLKQVPQTWDSEQEQKTFLTQVQADINPEQPKPPTIAAPILAATPP